MSQHLLLLPAVLYNFTIAVLPAESKAVSLLSRIDYLLNPQTSANNVLVNLGTLACVYIGRTVIQFAISGLGGFAKVRLNDLHQTIIHCFYRQSLDSDRLSIILK